jgi:hypothetical protein
MKSTKICSKCGEEKPVTEFYRQAGGKDGLRAACKRCFIVANSDYRARKSDKMKMGSKAYFKQLKKLKESYTK